VQRKFDLFKFPFRAPVRIGLVLVLLVVGFGLGTRIGAAEEAAEATEPEKKPSLLDALKNGKLTLGLRYRYEDVSQERFEKDGRASTLRTNLAYRSGVWNLTSLFLEFEDIRDLGLGNDHNNKGAGSLWNGVTDRPVIADPPLTALNQAYLNLKTKGGFGIRAGQQEIVISNQRYVGAVAWRQHHQSFAGAKMVYDGLARSVFTYSYIGRQYTVVGGSKPMNTHLGDFKHDFEKLGTLRAYGVYIDYDRAADSGFSSATLGASLDGSPVIGDKLKLLYRAELAQQKDAGSNINRVDAKYARAELGLGFGNLSAKAGYELLGGSLEDGRFTTPLATLHAFNGWADIFLNTPVEGLQDFFLEFSGSVAGIKLGVIYHDFSADSGSMDYGSEFDLIAVYKAPWGEVFGIKAAFFDADDYGQDTDKIWFWTQISF